MPTGDRLILARRLRELAPVATAALLPGLAQAVDSGDPSPTLVLLLPAPLDPVIKTSTGLRHLPARL